MKTAASSLLIMLGYVAIMAHAHAQQIEFEHRNTAAGHNALENLTTGKNNTALGAGALFHSTQCNNNTAIGASAMAGPMIGQIGSDNTAIGVDALIFATGNDNIGLGIDAGGVLRGNSNICIGNFGTPTDSGTIRIGGAKHVATFIAGINGARVSGGIVQVNSDGKLGTAPSSARFKHEIRPIDTESEAIFALNPVTFCYNQDIDSQAMPQFGLIAEEVAKVNTALVLPDKEGKPYTVRYEAVNAMLLNEFLKEHRKVEEQQATIAELRKDLKTAVAELKGQIQKVSAQLDLSKHAPQTVLNDH